MDKLHIEDNYIRHIYAIESIYDGDTITAIVEGGYNGLARVIFRFKGINTAEIRGSKGMRLALAHEAKTYVENKLLNTRVRVYSEKFEDGSFGRYMGTLFYENEDGDWVNLNAELFDIGLAQEYYKGASKDFGEWFATKNK